MITKKALTAQIVTNNSDASNIEFAPRFFVHSAKAVKKGEPHDRVFLVVASWNEGRKIYNLGWKCTVQAGGLKHPAYQAGLKTAAAFRRGATNRGRAPGEPGSEPTAIFANDSFYTEVTLEELPKIIASRMKAT